MNKRGMGYALKVLISLIIAAIVIGVVISIYSGYNFGELGDKMLELF